MKVTVSLKDLANLQKDYEFYRSQAISYQHIRNRMVREINDLLKEKGLPEKYSLIEVEDE
jgi:DNA polymerase III delta prime subunit